MNYEITQELADAKPQVKYVSAIWQRLIPATSNDI
ncbi:3'-5' exoribonuclease [Franconibacter daqui]|nr:3'-5' exoribonuclease [Franconibacter daqui]